MKVFLDTNILLDLLAPGRPCADISSTVVDGLFKNRHEIMVTTQSLVDIYYIAQRFGVTKLEIDVLTSWMLNHSNVRSINCFDLRLALEDINPDFEDNAQIVRAEDSNCDIFLTSDKKIIARGLESMLVLTPEQFVERMR